MDHDPLPGDHPETERVSTGALPPDTDVQALISVGYERYLHLDEGPSPTTFLPWQRRRPAPSACVLPGFMGGSDWWPLVDH